MLAEKIAYSSKPGRVLVVGRPNGTFDVEVVVKGLKIRSRRNYHHDYSPAVLDVAERLEAVEAALNGDE
jgi:hypothetical protein